MKALISTALWLALISSALAQPRDTTKTKTRTTPRFNPNARRNGFETYQSATQIVGSGPLALVNTVDNRYEGLRGTPYFLPDWNKGEIELVNEQSYPEVPAKFDAYRQQLVLKQTWLSGDSIVVDAERVKSFQLRSSDGRSYRFERIPTAKTNETALKEGYFLVLYKGETALLKRVTKVFKRADFKDPYSNDVRYDAFKDAFAYYVLKPDRTLVKVKLSKKSLLEVLTGKGDALKTFLDQRNVAVKTEKDAVALVRQYDSL